MYSLMNKTSHLIKIECRYLIIFNIDDIDSNVFSLSYQKPLVILTTK